MNLEVDKFIKSSKTWVAEVKSLRELLLKADLDENFKWRLPCYSHGESNIVIIQPFKSCLALMFFKGKLLKDPKDLLVDNGPNSQAARRLEFTSVADIAKKATVIKAYVKEAVALEKSGAKIDFKEKPEVIPTELKDLFKKEPKFAIAFKALTPGRQRAYLLHFSGAKQSSTRLSRIEKHKSRILQGKGLTDR